MELLQRRVVEGPYVFFGVDRGCSGQQKRGREHQNGAKSMNEYRLFYSLTVMLNSFEVLAAYIESPL